MMQLGAPQCHYRLVWGRLRTGGLSLRSRRKQSYFTCPSNLGLTDTRAMLVALPKFERKSLIVFKETTL